MSNEEYLGSLRVESCEVEFYVKHGVRGDTIGIDLILKPFVGSLKFTDKRGKDVTVEAGNSLTIAGIVEFG